MKLTGKIALWAILTIVVAGIGVTVFLMIGKKEDKPQVHTVELVVKRGGIRDIIATTGSVAPQNRLELKPPAGRLEELLIKEGDKVKAGQIIGWLSSTERAALLDAARAHDQKELDYWKEVYKPIPLIAPIDGEVIVSKIEPGQTISADTPVVVLSDRLIVNANVDETDVGKIKEGQHTEVRLDAYPEVTASGRVDHISYESKVVNNVTIYEVDIVCDKVPDVFRSGMSAEVKITDTNKLDVLLIPDEVITHSKGESFVYVKDGAELNGTKRKIETGISNDGEVEVVSGLKAGDIIVYSKKDFSLQDMNSPQSNPFQFSRPASWGKHK